MNKFYINGLVVKIPDGLLETTLCVIVGEYLAVVILRSASSRRFSKESTNADL